MTVAGCPQPQGLSMSLSLPSSRHPSPSIRARVHSAHQAAVAALLPDIFATPLYASKSSGTCPSSHHRRARCIAPTYSCADPAVCPFFGLGRRRLCIQGAFWNIHGRFAPRASFSTTPRSAEKRKKKKRCILLERILAFSGELRSAKKRKKKKKVHSSRRNPRLLRRLELQAPTRMMRRKKEWKKTPVLPAPIVSYHSLPPSRQEGTVTTAPAPAREEPGTAAAGGPTRFGRWLCPPSPPQTPHTQHHHMSTPPSLPSAMARSLCSSAFITSR